MGGDVQYLLSSTVQYLLQVLYNTYCKYCTILTASTVLYGTVRYLLCLL